jgi:thioredoxin 1
MIYAARTIVNEPPVTEEQNIPLKSIGSIYMLYIIEIQGRNYIMSEGAIAHISDAEFEQEVIKADIPVLVDFWAPWCGPCLMVAPMLEELAQELSGKVKITKMNVDENPTTPPLYGIRAIPTLILFKKGEVVEQITGVVPKDQLKSKLEKAA